MDLPQEMLATSHAAEGTEQNANIDEASAVNRCNRKRRPKIHPIWKNFKEVRKPLARIFVCEMNIQLKMIYNSDAEDYNPIYLIAAALDPNTIGILSDIDLNTAAEWICKMLPSEQLMQEVPSVYHLKLSAITKAVARLDIKMPDSPILLTGKKERMASTPIFSQPTRTVSQDDLADDSVLTEKQDNIRNVPTRIRSPERMKLNFDLVIENDTTLRNETLDKTYAISNENRVPPISTYSQSSATISKPAVLTPSRARIPQRHEITLPASPVLLTDIKHCNK
ncbi:hypothetical protein DdX_06873 [Ditylenchus destructor]|uniref:Uncharacterized protein n=1 Tax=Ditylenchus destructor TaxID=166010 RepID=A0AAD4NA51_9BILA|nr:hypothetical protein DdX_06873 [Ditylenchus destructor]